jgi:hypothetical protein
VPRLIDAEGLSLYLSLYVWNNRSNITKERIEMDLWVILYNIYINKRGE